MESLVGEGGMGVVYATRDAQGTEAVLKRLHRSLRSDPVSVQQFIEESDLLNRVRHHNVVRVVDHGHDDQGPFLVMTRATGQTLSAILDRDGALQPRRAFAIASQIIAGVAAIHGEGIVHGDIKSSNVLLDDNDRVTIIDFGLARRMSTTGSESTLAWSRVIAGTPAYMAPELVAGAAPSRATDTYAIGVILYEMLTGNTVFASSSNILDAQRFEPAVAPSQRVSGSCLSQQVDRFVLRALEKVPTDRFRSATEMAQALDRLVATEWQATTVVMERTSSTNASEAAETIVDALDDAGRMIDARRPERAIELLEHATSKVDSPDVWRIEMVLAALYVSLGHRERGREVAASAFAHARETRCAHAIARTTALARRLGVPVTGPRRFARGSGRFDV